MLIADLRGKLTHSELVSEDFLTSSVFSVFRYLNEDWLEEFANEAVNIRRERLNVHLENPHYEFWPWYANKRGFGSGAEPDVVIYSGQTALIIEAKNYSGKSGEGVVFDEFKEASGKGESKVIVDQLGREYFVGLDQILNSKHTGDDKTYSTNSFYLIYLTRHNSFPEQEIEDTISCIAKVCPNERENASHRIYWINWQKVVPVLEKVISVKTKDSFEHMISEELIAFLERRGLNVFSGFAFADHYRGLSNKLRLLEGADFLFYRRVFRRYWQYLSRSKLIEPKNRTRRIFYQKSIVPYWDFLAGDLSIQSEKTIFYWEVNK